MDSTLPELQSAQSGPDNHTPLKRELGKVKTHKVLRELAGGTEPLELERNSPGKTVGNSPWTPRSLRWA